MDFQTIMENIKKEMGEVPKPLKLLGELNPDLVVEHITAKKKLMTKEGLPAKYKSLILLAAAFALDSQACILNNLKEARKNGATHEEIAEVYSLARFAKSSTTVSNFAPALEWLFENK